MEKKLHRIPEHAVFGGVASGIAQYLQIDVVIVRVLFVVMLFLPLPPSFGWTGILYLILWAVLPTGPAVDIYSPSSTDPNFKPSEPFFDKKKSDQTVMILGGVLIVFGAVMLLDDFPIWYEFKRYFWPIVFIAIGAFLILRQRDKQHESNTTVYPTTPPPPVEPITPEPEPQPYTPFSSETTTPTHFPEDPESKKPDEDDDQVIKVN
ncbi:PspC domain-containing protein [Dyadobacter arcticus]|uniref:Phage shock protein PspC (Stress-responsive transcriptional regulator) n=1 Tax=Dyadobacter arcticus TaxID=1078754 RepID=A0ABX0UK58_9BACT|nr:PspC domain-containing protein [Dyadobacter arcticus]NIJ53402.1 phage shock protein PspC (stress-responsive transcriptional regulator) [Dyadobacter arcticus]